MRSGELETQDKKGRGAFYQFVVGLIRFAPRLAVDAHFLEQRMASAWRRGNHA